MDYRLVDEAVGRVEGDGNEKAYRSNWIKIEDDEQDQENLEENNEFEREEEKEERKEEREELLKLNKVEEKKTSLKMNLEKAPPAPPINKEILIKARNKIETTNEDKKNIPCPPPLTMTLLK